MRKIHRSSFSFSSIFSTTLTLTGLALLLLVIHRQQDIRERAAYFSCPVEQLSWHIPAGPETESAKQSQSLKSITRELVNETKKYRQTLGDDKNSIRQELLAKARERKAKLLATIQASPEAALSALLPALENSQLQAVLDESCTEQQVAVKGRLSIWEGDFSGGISKSYYSLTTDSGAKKFVHIANNRMQGLITGQTVLAKGIALDNTLLVDGSGSKGIEVVAEVPNAQLTNTTGSRPSLAVLVAFTDAYPVSSVSSVDNFIFNTVSNFYSEASYNKTSLTGDTVGVVRLPIAETCDPDKLGLATFNAIDASVDFRNYEHIIINSPFSSCGNILGYSTLGRETYSTNDGIVSFSTNVVNERYTGSVLVLGHEFGHSLGVKHSAFANCGAVGIGDNCQLSEYGDAYDIMGNRQSWHFNAAKKDKLGWFDSVNIRTITENGTYLLEPLETATAGVKVLKIARGDGTYLYIEYRQPVGVDANSVYPDIYGGALIHVDQEFAGDGGGIDTELVDASPPGDIQTPVLHPGEAVIDPVSGITVAVISKTANSLDVQISGLNGTSPTGSQNISGNTQIALTVWLHGVGKAGDNVSSGAGNVNPLNTMQTAYASIYDANNTYIGMKQGIIRYSTTTGKFTGSVDLESLDSGVYTVKLKVNKYLTKTVPGIVTLSRGNTVQLPALSLVAGDVNNDNRLDVLDYSILADCYSDFAQPKNCSDAAKKAAADLTDDGKVNQFDYNLFLRELSVQSGQ